MYILRSRSVEQVVLGQRKLEYLVAFLLMTAGAVGFGFAALLALGPEGFGLLGALSLLLLFVGSMMFGHQRSQAATLIFDNPHRSLLFVQRKGLHVPVPYSQIKCFETAHVRLGDSNFWLLGALFHDGTTLPLLNGSEKRMRAREQDFRQWIPLDAGENGAELPLPPLPAWIDWQEGESSLHCSWKSRLPWNQILLSSGFILAFAVMSFLSAKPMDLLGFWIFRGFSAVLTLLGLVMLLHGIRTRERRWWLDWTPTALSWGYRSFITRRQRKLGELKAGQVEFYWTFGEPRLVVLDHAGETELQRKRRLNPSYSMHQILHLLDERLHFDMELPGFKPGEVMLLKESLELWQLRSTGNRSLARSNKLGTDRQGTGPLGSGRLGSGRLNTGPLGPARIGTGKLDPAKLRQERAMMEKSLANNSLGDGHSTQPELVGLGGRLGGSDAGQAPDLPRRDGLGRTIERSLRSDLGQDLQQDLRPELRQDIGREFGGDFGGEADTGFRNRP